MHPLLRIFVWFIVVLFVLEMVFLFFATPILRSTIQQIIYTESKGVYSVHFDSLSLDLGRRSFHLFGFSLTPDTALYRKLSENDDVKAALYDIKFDRLTLEGLLIVKLYKRRQLKFSRFTLVHPQVKLLGLPKSKKDDKEKYDAVNEDLYPALLRYLNLVQIDKVMIESGEFDFRKNPQSNKQTSFAKNISITLKKFYLNGELFLHGQQLFFSEAVYIDVQGYSMLLSNDKQMLETDSIHIDSELGELYTFNTRIHTVDTANSEGSFDIHIPVFKINGVDLNDAFYKKKVGLASIEIHNSHIKIRSANKTQTDTSSFTANSLILFPLIRNSLKEVSIDTFKLSNASIEVHNMKSADKPAILMDNINIQLFNFLLDSVSHLNTAKILYADDIEFSVGFLQVFLQKSDTRLKARNIFASTRSDKIMFEEVFFSSTNARKKISISGNMSYALMQGIHLHSAYHKGILPIDKLILQDGSVSILREEDTSQLKLAEMKPKRNSDSELLSTFMKKIVIGKVQILNTSYNYSQRKVNERKLESMGNLEALFTNVSVFPTGKKSYDDIVYLDDIQLNFRNFYFRSPKNPHIFKVNALFLSTADSVLRISDLHMWPDSMVSALQLMKDYKKSSLSTLRIDTIEFRKFDITEAWFDKKLKADAILINHAYLKQEMYPQLKKLYGKRGSELIDSDFGMEDSVILSFVGDTTVSIVADANELMGPPDSITGLEMELIAADTSVFRLRDLSFFKLLYHFTDEVDIKQTWMKNAKITLIRKDTSGVVNSRSNNTLDVKLTGLNFNMFMPVDSVRNSSRLLMSDNLQLDFDAYEYELPDNIHLLKVGRIKIDTKAKELSLYNASLTSKAIPDTLNYKSYFDIRIPAVKVWGIDYLQLVMNKRLMVDSIICPVTKVEWLAPVFKPERNKAVKNPFEQPMPKLLKVVDIRSVRFNEIIVNRNTRLIGSSLPSMSGVFAMSSSNLFIDSASWHTFANKLPIADLRLEGRDFKFFIKDSLHTVSLNFFRYTSANKFLTGNGLSYSFANDSSLTSRLHRFKKSATINLYAPLLNAEGIDMNSYYSSKNVDIQYLLLENANIEYTAYPQIKKQYRMDTLVNDLYLKFKRNLNSISAKNIELSNMDVKYNIIQKFDSIAGGNKYYSFNNVNGEWKNLLLDSVHRTIDKNNVFGEDVILVASNINFPLRNPDFKLKLGEMKLNLLDSSISITNMSYLPVDSYYAFMSEATSSRSYFKMKINQTTLKGVQWDLFINRKWLKTRRAEVDGLWYYTFRDKKYPSDTTNTKPMLYGMLKSLKTPFSIDSLYLNNSTIEVEELREEGLIPGNLNISRINANAQNITNIDTFAFPKKPLRLQFEAYLMNSAKMKMSGKVPYFSKNNEFMLAGSIDTFHLNILNPYLENTNNISIKSGFVDGGRFVIEGNDSLATGTMRLRYHNLKVNLMKAKRDSSMDNRGITSMLANTLIPTSNPRKGRIILREGYIYTQRDNKRGVITYWIDTLLSGIKSTLEPLHEREYRKTIYNHSGLQRSR